MSGQDMGVDSRSSDLIRELEAVLGRRVSELEVENARLRRLTRMLMAGVFVALVLSIGTTVLVQTAPNRVASTVQAQRFVLRDAAGNVRAVLGATAEGGTRLSMQDHTGGDRLRMTLLADGSPGLSFADRDGRSRVVLAFLPDETANLVFADGAGQTRAIVGLMPDESATLAFANRRGEMRVGVGVDAAGVGELSVFEQDVAATPEPELDPAAADTTVAAGAPTAPAGR